MRHGQLGAIFFGLWGLLHVIGGIAILVALANGPAAGYAVYQNAEGQYPPIAGAILGMNSFAIALVGAVVCVIAVTMHNSRLGMVLNLALAGGMDLALIIFLLRPGYVTVGEALIGLGLFACAALFAGLSFRSEPKVAHTLPPHSA
jgi:hypothetical protein